VTPANDELISAHLRITAALKTEEAAWDKRRKELKQLLMSVEGVLNARILAQGPEQNSIRGEEGTAFNRTATFVSVQDKEALKDYITKTGDLSFLGWEVERAGVESYIEAHAGHAPPGVRVTKIIQTIVRKV